MESGSKWVNGIYEYPGKYYPERSINYMYLSSYINGPYQAYYLDYRNLNAFTITIDKSDNGAYMERSQVLCHAITAPLPPLLLKLLMENLKCRTGFSSIDG